MDEPLIPIVYCQWFGMFICFLMVLNSMWPSSRERLSETGYNDGLSEQILNTEVDYPMSMYVECVITCVNYSDFLSHALLWNKRHFDRLIVITKPDDWHTANVCKFHHVECYPTEEFGEGFNKAKGINYGFSKLSKKDWIVHLDSDIVLSPHFRQLLHNIPLDKQCIYGIDRVMCDSPNDWFNFISNPDLQQEDDVFVRFPDKFKIGTRIFKNEYGGYIPIGYFQLFNVAAGNILYPVEHESAARTDMLFAAKWPRDKRILIPEFYAYHISSEPTVGVMGKNWNGRQSKQFCVLTESEKQAANLAAIDKEWSNVDSPHQNISHD